MGLTRNFAGVTAIGAVSSATVNGGTNLTL